MVKMRILDVHSRAISPVAQRLSNLWPRPFVLDDKLSTSMEGFLQSLKFELEWEAQRLRDMDGVQCWKAGQAGNEWKQTHRLWWNGVPYDRLEMPYQYLLDRAYDAQLDQNQSLRDDLRATVGFQLRHLRGKHDVRDTVLTESEYISRLERLRWRALEEEEVECASLVE